MGDIFVFGANKRGVHGAGAARVAAQRWGAVHGVGEGMTGNAYAIPTKDHRLVTLDLPSIQASVDRFVACASHYYRTRFLLTEVGCGLAGYRACQILPLFEHAVPLRNVYWPERWARRLELRRISFDTSYNLVANRI